MTSRRRHFSERELARYPLTQPPNRCQRCSSDAAGILELDHMVELHAGGIDHPYNLVRLCSACHRQKPVLDPTTSAAARRLAVITWIRSAPPVLWDDPTDTAWRKRVLRLALEPIR